jgi:GT2 family glycosyltransferase
VAVVIVHDPGPSFDATLVSLAVQDYPALRVLVLDTSGAASPNSAVGDELLERLALRLPEAFVHHSSAPTHAAAANEVLQLVEGGGFFCFLHDDVELASDAIRLLVEELYRSNAGIVGPKLVDRDDPGRLQAVGLALDKFGELAPPTGAGELDQEQHDAVTDVFALPSACLLVRADLFRTLGGFDPAIDGPGDEIDLCWRAHVSGARVLVAPAARVAHLGLATGAYDQLDDRAARNRLRAVLGNYSVLSLLRVLPQWFVLSFVRSIGLLLTGRIRQAAQPLGGWAWNLARLPSLVRKRRAVARIRRVHDGEIRRLQRRGSARLAAALREASVARDDRNARLAGGLRRTIEQVRSGSHWPTTLVWSALVALVVIGSRGLLSDGIAPVGRLFALPDDVAGLLRRPIEGWSPQGLGSATAVAPGLGVVGLVGLLAGGSTELARTLLVVLPVAVGLLGMWRLTRSFGVRRARLVTVVAYAANPLPYAAVAAGRWDGLVAYAGCGWLIGALGRLAGWAPLSGARRPIVQSVASLALGLALLGLAVPGLVPVAVGSAALLAIGSLAAGERTGTATLLTGTAVAAVAAAVLLLPWSWTVVGDPVTAFDAAYRAPGADALARFAIAGTDPGPLTWGLWAAAAVALAIGGSWRSAWGARATVLAVGALAATVAGGTGALGLDLPDPAVTLAPAAAGLALAAGAAIAAAQVDLTGTRLTWRQPLVLVVYLGLAAAAVPVVGLATDGRWDQPRRGDADELALLPVAGSAGAMRTLWLGDPDRLPLASTEWAPGTGWALVDGLAPTVEQAWPREPSVDDRNVIDLLDAAVAGQTNRLGRLLGSRSIRFVVLPRPQDPAVASLVAVLRRQLDLAEIDAGSTLAVFANQAAIPKHAVLTGAAREASELAGIESLARADLDGALPVLESEGPVRASGPVPAGTLFASIPFDSGWRLQVDGRTIPARPAFGWATAFEVPAAGFAVLERPAPASRTAWSIAVGLAWLVALRLAWAGRLLPNRRPRTTGSAEPTRPLIALEGGPADGEDLEALPESTSAGDRDAR